MLFFRNPEKKQNPSGQQQIQQQCRDEASNPFLPFLLQKVNCRKRTEHEYKYQPEQSKQAGQWIVYQPIKNPKSEQHGSRRQNNCHIHR